MGMLDGFTIPLTFPYLTLQDQFNDGPCAGLRYGLHNDFNQPSLARSSAQHLTEHTLITETAPPESQRNVGPDLTSPAMNFSPIYIPVYTDAGPSPATEAYSYNRWLSSRIPVASVGEFRRVVTDLTTGNPDNPLETRNFSVEMDLGSSEMWVYGTASKTAEGPRGAPGARAHFWSFITGSTNELHSSAKHNIEYGDGSRVSFTLYSDFFQFNAHRPPSTTEPNRNWLWMTFGVAHKVLGSFRRSPASGLLGLGRKMTSPQASPDKPISFLQQLEQELTSPEFVITLGAGKGVITFGRRPSTVVPPTLIGPWSNNIPVIGNKHWTVSSTKKVLNNQQYSYEDGSIVLDTGTAFCYMDPQFTKDLYDLIPGSFYDARPIEGCNRDVGVYLIPLDTQNTPTVQFDVGGTLFSLEDFFLCRDAMDHLKYNGKHYATGPIQSKENLYPLSPAYNGPDIMGRVAIVNMEVVCQFPKDKPHTISWRRKDIRVLRPGPV